MKIWLCESIGKEELIKGNWRESNGDEKNHLGGYKSGWTYCKVLGNGKTSVWCLFKCSTLSFLIKFIHHLLWPIKCKKCYHFHEQLNLIQMRLIGELSIL